MVPGGREGSPETREMQRAEQVRGGLGRKSEQAGRQAVTGRRHVETREQDRSLPGVWTRRQAEAEGPTCEKGPEGTLAEDAGAQACHPLLL